MSSRVEVVITGLGVVSPIGIGSDAFWQSLMEGRSGVRPLTQFDARNMPVNFGGEVPGFDPKQWIKPRKSLKIMSRDIQLGFTAADLACQDAGIRGAIDPERLGCVMGTDLIQCQPEDVAAAFRASIEDGEFDFKRWAPAAMQEIYPLWMLKHLPNMPACHIGIYQDARGPNNSVTLGEVSGLLAVSEAMHVIERGQADAMIAGGSSSRVHPTIWVRSCIGQVSKRVDAPTAASRPFDRDRDGFVNGEGAAVFILERRDHAEARGAKVLARVLGYSGTFEPRVAGRPPQGTAIRKSIAKVLRAADVTPADLGHVNAHGLGTTIEDRVEAQAIAELLGTVPVTAAKSFFGNLGSSTGAVELAASVLSFGHEKVPYTLNYERPDPECPVNVVRGQPLAGRAPMALALNQAAMGQSVALVVAGP